MGLGYRVFFIQGDDVNRVSQKAFGSLHLKNNKSMLKYSSQTVLSALVFYELEDRKPKQIVRIDTQKIRFNSDGTLDDCYEQEGLMLVAGRVDKLLEETLHHNNQKSRRDGSAANDSVIDATDRFDERRWKQRHPELPGPTMKVILESVFGKIQ